MFGIGPVELAVVLVVALLVMGPKKLPELARTVGRGLAEFRRASNDLRRSMDLDLESHKIEPPPAPAQTSSPYQPPEPGSQLAESERENEVEDQAKDEARHETKDEPEDGNPDKVDDEVDEVDDEAPETDSSDEPPVKRDTEPTVD
ncbi:MAG: twin-arginine translocase TatA/TatE family subunit [Deltaproteobacteria bacterium]|nr:twin-arginine translocase TatA/TatE family subunit [Deltaproteobacteria bacterium]